MNNLDKLKKAPFALTLSDANGKIFYMNEKAALTFSKYGENLIGRDLLECHNENSRKKIMDMFKKKYVNAYTIEKKGVKKLIYQFPIEDEKGFAGYGEISIELPEKMPHFVRK